MSFTVDDFQDLLRLLDQRPEWRDELRQRLLTPEVLQLPALVARVVERLDALTEAQVRTEQRLDALTEAQVRTEQRLDALTKAQIRLTGEVATLARTAREHNDRLGRLDGKVLEWSYQRNAPAYFGRLARRARLVEPSQLADLLDDAVDQGRLTEAERVDVLLADLVVRGRWRADQTEVFMVAEVSVGVGVDDVRRAVKRASALAKLGTPTIPVVAGEEITAAANDYARSSGVWQFLDGRIVEPAGT